MFNKVVEIITRYQDIEAEQIHMNSHLINDLSLNSLEITEMICDIEDLLGFEIQEEQISQFRTVGDVVKYLEQVA